MKRLTVSLMLLVLAFSTLPIPQSDAIFGLSKCEKVQKQVFSIEKNINSKIIYLKKFEGKVLNGKPFSIYNSVIDSNFMIDLWKIGYNNPKCFTNTQKLVIKQLPEVNKNQFIYADGAPVYYKTEKCKDGVSRLIDSSCLQSRIYTLKFANQWQSLYEY